MASSSSMLDYWKRTKRRKAVTPAPGLMTVDDYFSRTPRRLSPAELIYGAIRLADAPLPRHQSAVACLFRALDRHVREHALGRMWIAPLDVVLSEGEALIVQPDLFFVSNRRDWIVRDRVRGAPDLVIEILSPHPRIGKTQERIGWFRDHGVRECWLVHQDTESVTVIEFEDRAIARKSAFARRETIASAVLPDFVTTLDEILFE
jgi:Uma2 family endonuclease